MRTPHVLIALIAMTSSPVMAEMLPDAPDSYEGMAVVEVDGRMGYIDKTGEWVIPPAFDHAEYFSEGLAAVRVGGVWGYVDRTGHLQIEPRFSNAQEFVSGLAAVQIDDEDEWGYIDHEGKFAIKPKFARAFQFYEGIARVTESLTETGFIKPSGRYIVKPHYESAENVSFGMAGVRRDGKWGFVNIESNSPLTSFTRRSYSAALRQASVVGSPLTYLTKLWRRQAKS